MFGCLFGYLFGYLFGSRRHRSASRSPKGLHELTAILTEGGSANAGVLAQADHVEDAASGLLGIGRQEHRLGDQRVAGD